MQARDLIHASLEAVEDMHRAGRISDATWRRFQTFWTWAAPRFSEPACSLRFAYAQAHGEDALALREQRLRQRLFGRAQ